MKLNLFTIFIFNAINLIAQADSSRISIIDGIVINEHVPTDSIIPYKALTNPNVYWNECDTIYSNNLDKEPTFKKNASDMLQFFNDSILELIYDSTSADHPPTSFKMIIIINDKNEVERIAEVHGIYSEEIKMEILKRLKNEQGWKSGEINGQKVCSKFYFNIGCILWN
jgi:hypothetical protein